MLLPKTPLAQSKGVLFLKVEPCEFENAITCNRTGWKNVKNVQMYGWKNVKKGA